MADNRINLFVRMGMGVIVALSSSLLVRSARAAETETPATRPAENETVDAVSHVDKVEAAVNGLDLNEEQKGKVKDHFASIRAMLDKVKSKSGVPRAAFTKAMNELRDKLGSVLSEEQKAKLRVKLESIGMHQPIKGGALAGLRERLKKVGLSEEQKAKIEGMFEAHEAKIKKVAEELKGDKDAMMKKLKPEFDAMHNEVSKLLTREQASKLVEEQQKEQTKPAESGK